MRSPRPITGTHQLSQIMASTILREPLEAPRLQQSRHHLLLVLRTSSLILRTCSFLLCTLVGFLLHAFAPVLPSARLRSYLPAHLLLEAVAQDVQALIPSLRTFCRSRVVELECDDDNSKTDETIYLLSKQREHARRFPPERVAEPNAHRFESQLISLVSVHAELIESLPEHKDLDVTMIGEMLLEGA